MGTCSRGLLIASCLLTLITGALCEMKLEILPAMERQTIAIGKDVVLTCKTEGHDISDMQWHDPKGKMIPSANEAQRPPMYTEMLPGSVLVLIINNLREIDAGNYTCTAMYANTQKLSKSINIQTIEAITWVDAPLEQHPILNEDYTIRCQVTAKPSPVVDWLRNGEMLNSRYVLDSANGLLLRKPTAEDDGVYKCRAIVMETGELQERNIRVEVYTPPTLEEMQPQSEAIEGDAASLECRAKGKPNPTYTWLQVSTKMDLSSAGRFSVDAVTGILTIAPAKREDQGEYKCVAKNDAGMIEKTVQLVVVVKPQLLPIQNVSVPMGKDKNGHSYKATLECIATGRPLPDITFSKVGSEASFTLGLQQYDDRIVVENVQNSDRQEMTGKLIVNDILRSDDGLYACIATNKGGEARANGHLTVQFPPSFANTPKKEVWSWKDNPVNITCLAEAIPNATIKWRLNNRDIDDDPNFRKFGALSESSLQVMPNTPQLYGAYKCVATNGLGEAEHTIELKKAHIPGPIMQAKLDVMTATTITFSFVGPRNGAGLPTKAYVVQYKERNQEWNDAKIKTWAVDSPHILEHLQPQTTYTFRFAAQNDVGTGEWAEQITRVMPKRSTPEEPRILNTPHEGVVSSPYADKFVLQWQIPADNGERIDKYDIKICAVTPQSGGRWQEKDNACRTIKLPANNDQSPSYKLDNLSADTHYKLELRAHNEIGFSTPSEVIIKTAQDPGKAGSGTLVSTSDGPILSSGAIVSIVVASLFVVLIVIDLLCFYMNKSGIIMTICEKTRSKPDDTDIKHGSDEKEPLKDEKKQLSPVIQKSMMRETSVEYDVKKSRSQTNFVGKDSAV